MPRTLTSIERFARKEVSRNVVLHLITHNFELVKIQEFRDALRHSLGVFNVSNGNIQRKYFLMIYRYISGQDRPEIAVFQQGEANRGPQECHPPVEIGRSSGKALKQPIPSPNFVSATEPEVPGSSCRNSHGVVSTAPSSVQVTLGIEGHQNTVDTSHHITITDSEGVKTTTNLNSKNDSSRHNIHINTTTCNVYYGWYGCLNPGTALDA